VSDVLRFIVPGAPVPCGRARSGKGRIFTPAKTRGYQDLVHTLALVAVRRAKWNPPEGSSFAVVFDIHRARRSGDWDNFAKSLCDGMNGVVWPDDRAIVSATVRLHLDRLAPRAEITVSLAMEVAA
jgi:crossover junction endodeoxyribonuclease RusA